MMMMLVEADKAAVYCVGVYEDEQGWRWWCLARAVSGSG